VAFFLDLEEKIQGFIDVPLSQKRGPGLLGDQLMIGTDGVEENFFYEALGVTKKSDPLFLSLVIHG
jgi:hypothetical protein